MTVTIREHAAVINVAQTAGAAFCSCGRERTAKMPVLLIELREMTHQFDHKKTWHGAGRQAYAECRETCTVSTVA